MKCETPNQKWVGLLDGNIESVDLPPMDECPIMEIGNKGRNILKINPDGSIEWTPFKDKPPIILKDHEELAMAFVHLVANFQKDEQKILNRMQQRWPDLMDKYIKLFGEESK